MIQLNKNKLCIEFQVRTRASINHLFIYLAIIAMLPKLWLTVCGLLALTRLQQVDYHQIPCVTMAENLMVVHL